MLTSDKKYQIVRNKRYKQDSSCQEEEKEEITSEEYPIK